MKKLIFIFFGVLLILLYSCSKEMIESDQEGDLKDLTCGQYGHKVPKGPVFTVYPNGTDDTQALIDAFDAAKAAGPGSTVRLVEGQYIIGMVEVRDFDGYFRGAGKGKSIITNLSELPCEECWELDLLPSLLTFIGGNITITDMTIHLNDGRPCAEGYLNDLIYGDLCTTLVLSDYSGTYVPANPHIKGVVKNVDFIGGDDDGYGVYGTENNVNMAVYCGADFAFGTGNDPLSNGEFYITGCRFEMHNCGPDAWSLNENSIFYVEDNYISDGLQQLFIGFCLGTKITVKNNKICNGLMQDIFIDNSDWGCYPNIVAPLKRSEINIIGNDIQSAPGVIGLYISDTRRTTHPDEGYPQLINVMGNVFDSQEGATSILGLNNVDAKIWNNRFTGTGTVGIMLDGNADTDTWAENNKIMTNNFLKATYTDAAVYLGPNTMNNKVVGVATDKVIDEGVNNIVIGVKAQKKGPHYIPGKHPHFKNMHENMMRMRSPQTQ
jgi:hypothetical protein